MTFPSAFGNFISDVSQFSPQRSSSPNCIVMQFMTIMQLIVTKTLLQNLSPKTQQRRLRVQSKAEEEKQQGCLFLENILQ